MPILQHWYHDLPTSYLKQGTLDSWDNIYFSLPYLSQESVVLSQPQLAYLYYLETSLTILQNCRITALVNLRLTPLECQKVTKNNNNKIDKYLIKRHHRYIYWVSHWLGKIQSSQPFWPPMVKANLKPYL